MEGSITPPYVKRYGAVAMNQCFLSLPAVIYTEESNKNRSVSNRLGSSLISVFSHRISCSPKLLSSIGIQTQALLCGFFSLGHKRVYKQLGVFLRLKQHKVPFRNTYMKQTKSRDRKSSENDKLTMCLIFS